MHIMNVMNYRYTVEDISVIAEKAKKARIRQDDISKALGVSQSQVSRVLSGEVKGRSKLLQKICIYVNNKVCSVKPKAVADEIRFINAITEVWDGSDQQADAICKIIRSLGSLCVQQRDISKKGLDK